jgi:hypothetical protein
MNALALRHLPRGEVIQLLTWHVAGVRDLPGVLAWRLGQVLTAVRRPTRQVPADENGTLYAAKLAARAGNTPGPAARAVIAAARAELAAIRRRCAGDQRAGPPPGEVGVVPPAQAGKQSKQIKWHAKDESRLGGSERVLAGRGLERRYGASSASRPSLAPPRAHLGACT